MPAAWWGAIRPRTLVAAIGPVAVGLALASRSGATIDWLIGVLCFAAALLLQIGTNLHNDLADFHRGADTTERIGPVRAVQAGLLSPGAVAMGATVAFFAAALVALPLIARGGWPIAIGAALSLLTGYAYTGGPKPLAYQGLGDPFVFLFFGLLAVAGTAFLQLGRWTPEMLVAGSQLGCLATVILSVNNLRDRSTDTRAGKRTLAVRFGESFARTEIATLLAIPFAAGVFWAARGAWGAALAPLLTLPMGISLGRAVAHTPPGPVFNGYLARSGQLLLAFAALLTGGLLL